MGSQLNNKSWRLMQGKAHHRVGGDQWVASRAYQCRHVCVAPTRTCSARTASSLLPSLVVHSMPRTLQTSCMHPHTHKYIQNLPIFVWAPGWSPNVNLLNLWELSLATLISFCRLDVLPIAQPTVSPSSHKCKIFFTLLLPMHCLFHPQWFAYQSVHINQGQFPVANRSGILTLNWPICINCVSGSTNHPSKCPPF